MYIQFTFKRHTKFPMSVFVEFGGEGSEELVIDVEYFGARFEPASVRALVEDGWLAGLQRMVAQVEMINYGIGAPKKMLMECNLFTREDQFDVAAAEAENLSF
jgi:hypothetical protein